ncbi:hypothetical protein ACFYST_12830 [Kitasatospora sp. NPDC004614]
MGNQRRFIRMAMAVLPRVKTVLAVAYYMLGAVEKLERYLG